MTTVLGGRSLSSLRSMVGLSVVTRCSRVGALAALEWGHRTVRGSAASPPGWVALGCGSDDAIRMAPGGDAGRGGTGGRVAGRRAHNSRMDRTWEKPRSGFIERLAGPAHHKWYCAIPHADRFAPQSPAPLPPTRCPTPDPHSMSPFPPSL